MSKSNRNLHNLDIGCLIFHNLSGSKLFSFAFWVSGSFVSFALLAFPKSALIAAPIFLLIFLSGSFMVTLYLFIFKLLLHIYPVSIQNCAKKPAGCGRITHLSRPERQALPQSKLWLLDYPRADGMRRRLFRRRTPCMTAKNHPSSCWL